MEKFKQSVEWIVRGGGDCTIYLWRRLYNSFELGGGGVEEIIHPVEDKGFD